MRCRHVIASGPVQEQRAPQQQLAHRSAQRAAQQETARRSPARARARAAARCRSPFAAGTRQRRGACSGGCRCAGSEARRRTRPPPPRTSPTATGPSEALTRLKIRGLAGTRVRRRQQGAARTAQHARRGACAHQRCSLPRGRREQRPAPCHASNHPPSSSRYKKRKPSMLPTPKPMTSACARKMAASARPSSWPTPLQKRTRGCGCGCSGCCCVESGASEGRGLPLSPAPARSSDCASRALSKRRTPSHAEPASSPAAAAAAARCLAG